MGARHYIRAPTTPILSCPEGLSADLIERLRNVVYRTPGVTLTAIVTEALRRCVEERETEHGGAFPKREFANGLFDALLLFGRAPQSFDEDGRDAVAAELGEDQASPRVITGECHQALDEVVLPFATGTPTSMRDCGSRCGALTSLGAWRGIP